MTISEHYNKDAYYAPKNKVGFFFEAMGVSREDFSRFRGCTIVKDRRSGDIAIHIEARNRDTEPQESVRRRM
jgi:hypothetical protein